MLRSRAKTIALNTVTLSTVWFFCGQFQATAGGITAEAVLGDYKSDPLFGEAAAKESVTIEVGTSRFAPQNIRIAANLNIRFVFTNSSNQTHLMVMASDLNEVLADQPFIDSYLEHGTNQVAVPSGHSHGNSSAEDASPMVKLIDEHPAVLLIPGDTKEVLVRFSNTHPIQLACVLDEHYKQGLHGTIVPYLQESGLQK